MFIISIHNSTLQSTKSIPYKMTGLSIMLIFSISLQGCAATNDASQTQREGTAAGAVIGGLMGVALGDSKESTLIGAAVGAVVGNMYGKHIANKKAEYEDTESYMNAMIAESDKVIIASRDQRNYLQSSIDSQKRLIAKLQQESGKQQDVKQQLSVQLEKNTKDLKVTEELLSAINKEIEIQQRVLNEERVQLASILIDQSEANIKSMESEKRQLQLLKIQLASLDYRRVY